MLVGMNNAPARQRSNGPLFLGVLSFAAHLVVGYFYLVGGLVIPMPVLLVLWLLWLVLAALLIRWTLERSWVTPLVPVGAAVVLVLTAVVGGTVFGWTA
jgi:hypothetical protein